MTQALYLLGGNGSCAAWWEDVLPHFRRYTPQVIELPGFGSNTARLCRDLDELTTVLLASTAPGAAIYAVGVNALVVLHALVRQPGHFGRVVIQSPIGAYLWQRRLPRLMRFRPLRQLVHLLLGHAPGLMRRKFSRQNWSQERIVRMGAGYRACRAFNSYWDIVRADTALTLFDHITDRIELVWGAHDGVIPANQAAAWEAILPRAALTVAIQPDWGHYPWIDDATGFAHWLESGATGFVAHGKAGRLQLAELAGLPVPARLTVASPDDDRLAAFLATQPDARWAVRSSGAHEDQIDHANAGLTRTFLRVPAGEVAARIAELLADGIGDVVVQRFVEPVLSGIAFARHLGAEIEWVDGHLAVLADGEVTPQRAVLSRLGGDWAQAGFGEHAGLTETRLWDFLQAVVRTFHYAHLDIEWAWDGRALHLLQARPVTSYPWRRHLTAANIGEILPPQPSRLIEAAQRHAAASIPAVWARWDGRVLADNEPFTACFGDASYINNDLFLARLADWGLPTHRYADEVGGAVPALPLRPWRLLRNLPQLLAMHYASRAALPQLETGLRRLDAELDALIDSGADGKALARWLTRHYVHTVQGNLCIAPAIASSGGAWLGRPRTVYAGLADAPHRLPFESDPATPRQPGADLPLQPFPHWPLAVQVAHKLGLPGLRGWYAEVREWYRDNLMRLLYKLHHAMPETEREYWFAPHPAPRTQSGSFWQDGSGGTAQQFGFVIVPGSVDGVVGDDILLVDTLDPGQYDAYRQARAVIARSGGKLSHGATLLRELGIPAAVLPDAPVHWQGRRVRYRDGVLEAID
ncbi:PEP-utilizing enzyme [Chitinolyticbacter meiyuanensis]|uniref:PEP-utilizing enzyme n=1 Tax=Chitinolyticbacter meiyuanensis TaxID=682798 RepID=UPI0011E590B2|nr:PEP-utilizing enzyme [Chitinolyticbacter meiyuanensis]